MKQDKPTISYRNIPKDNMHTIIPLAQQLNPNVSKEVLTKRLNDMLKLDYHTLGAYQKDYLIGIASYWFGTRFWCGKYIDIDNIVVDQKHRGQGIATALMQRIESIAQKEDCEICTLDSYTSNHESNHFYHKHRYKIEGYHFTKHLSVT